MQFFGYAARILIALVAGWIVYMIAAVVDVLSPVGGADGFVGIFIQAIMGAIITALAIAVVTAAGVPLMFLRGWMSRACFVLCLLLIVGGISSISLAWTPAFRQEAPHPEFSLSTPPGAPVPMIDVANGKMLICGWFAMLFGIVHASTGRERLNSSGITSRNRDP